MPKISLRAYSRYAAALALCAAALLARLALDRWLGHVSPFLLLVPAVMFSAWYGGLGPGLLATVAGAAVADYLLVAPDGFSRSAENLSRVAVFLLVGVQLSWLSGALRRARERAEGDAQTARAAERAARESEQRYRTLAANFPDGAVFLFDRDLRWLLADGTALAAAGLSPDRLVGRTLQEALPPDECRQVEPVYRSALAGKAATAEVCRAGRVYSVHAVPLAGAGGEVGAGLCIATDVTDRVRAREALRRSHDELEQRVRERTAELAYQKTLQEALSETSLDGILVVSPAGRVVYANRRFVELWDLPRSRAGLALDEVLHRMRLRVADGRDPLPRPAAGGVLAGEAGPELSLAGGTVLTCYGTDVRGADGAAHGRVWFFRDVTARKRLERQVLDVCEREQRRIGRDLHDGLGQHLTGVGLLGQSLHQRLSDRGAPEAADAGHIARLVEQAVGQARELARGLRPVAVDPEALVRALEELAALQERLTGVTCRVRADGAAAPPDDAVAMHLYRIAQEAVNNAVKHAKPGRVTIRLAREPNALRLSVEDDGVGLPPAPPHPAAGGGMGLQIMRHRAEMIGATFEARRVGAGGGTVIACRLPAANRAPPDHDQPTEHERGEVAVAVGTAAAADPGADRR